MDIEYKQLNQEADELLARCMRFERAYSKVFLALEAAQARIEYLENQRIALFAPETDEIESEE